MLNEILKLAAQQKRMHAPRTALTTPAQSRTNAAISKSYKAAWEAHLQTRTGKFSLEQAALTWSAYGTARAASPCAYHND